MSKLSTSLLTPATTAVVFFLAISGLALAAEPEDKKADTRPQKPPVAAVEYSCCDPDGVCLPASENAVCPAGYIKVVVCDPGEDRGCDL